MLRRDAGPAGLFVTLLQERREPLEDRVPAGLAGPQGMLGRHHTVEVRDGEKLRLGLRSTTHASARSKPPIKVNLLRDFFNSLIGKWRRRSVGLQYWPAARGAAVSSHETESPSAGKQPSVHYSTLCPAQLPLIRLALQYVAWWISIE